MIPMDQDAQKDFFEIAYRTGSDVWTHIPYHMIAMRMLPQLPADAFILDVGTGRGVWLGKLVASGYRVIGLDYISDVVRRGNADLKMQHMADRARFIHGDVLDIPLADQSFDAITDIGVLQHININDWNRYASELKRVVKPGGYVLNVSLSKETTRFLGFKPKTTDESQFEKFGVTYYFFTNPEVANIFEKQGFKLIEQKIEHFDAKTDPGDSIAMVFSLFQAI
jgi:ubiquinone/menaquinone biosynthesis C-methylase UbiE